MASASGGGQPDYCGPNAYRGVPDRLYRNENGKFLDISVASGVAKTARNGLGVVCYDFNGDAQDDILVANDGERNQLWINQGDGTFVDRGVWFGVATNLAGETEASMGIALGDVDGDLRLDAVMTHLEGETNTLCLASAAGPHRVLDVSMDEDRARNRKGDSVACLAVIRRLAPEHRADAPRQALHPPQVHPRAAETGVPHRNDPPRPQAGVGAHLKCDCLASADVDVDGNAARRLNTPHRRPQTVCERRQSTDGFESWAVPR